MDIYLPDAQTFDFAALTLADPVPVPGQNGFYTTKLSLKGKPVYMQLPQGVTKDAFVATKLGKYCDLMYERQQRGDLVAFFEQVEFTCQDLIDAQKNKWFQNDLTHDDIENMMSSVTRLYQSGKYVLIRAHIMASGANNSMKFVAYNEKEIGVDLDAVLPNRPVIPLLLLDGVKFSSKSFDIDLKLVQLMVLDDTSVSACLIKRIVAPMAPMARPGAESTPVENEPLARAAVAVPPPATATTPAPPAATTATASSLAPEPAGISFIITEPLGSPTSAETNEQPVVTNDPVAQEQQQQPEHFTESAAVLQESQPPAVVVQQSQQEQSQEQPQEQSQEQPQEQQPSQPIEIVLDQFQAVPPLEAMTLKKPNEVYYDIYRAARRKAKGLRKDAIEAYLEAKEIKTKYMLTDLDEASSSDDDDEDEDDEEEDKEEEEDDDDENDEGEESDGQEEDDENDQPSPPTKGGKAA